MTFEELDEFAAGYVRAIIACQGFWPFEDETEIEKWEQVDEDDFSPDSYRSIAADCATFSTLLELNVAGKSALELAYEKHGYGFEEAGADLWNTRMRSGVGYWDRDLGVLGDELATAASRLGEAFVEIGDDGLVRHSEPVKVLR